MKANVPEKIYVDSKAIGDNISTTVRTKPQDYPTCVEYTRADAFIEKAVRRLENYLDNGMWIANDVGYREKEAIIEDFKNYMQNESR